MSQSLLQIQYQDLYNHLNDQLLNEEVTAVINKKNFFDKHNWLKGLVICEKALNLDKVTEGIKQLYLNLYDKNTNLYFSSSLNEVDYDFWFKKSEEINDHFLKQNFSRAYAERDYMLETARRPYRNREKEKEYLLKGIEIGDSACMAIYGYNLYFGMRKEKEDKEKGLQWILKSKELGYERAEKFLLNITFYTEKDTTKILSAIEEFNNSQKEESEKVYHLLGEFYLYKEENLQKAKEALEEGIKNNCPFSKYLMGITILNGRISDYNKSKGIELLEEAYDYGIIYAANWLGRYYSYTQDENKSIEKSIFWHEKALSYYFEDSTIELARIYLYDETVKDEQKGTNYLNLAESEGSARAISEKANIILSEEQPDIEKAKELLEKASELGDSYASYRLGLLYERGSFGEPDYYKAFELYKLATDRGYIYGIELVGHYYRVGISKVEEADPEKAITYLNMAIEGGSDYAKVELALCYESGFGVEKDYQKAYDLFKAAAENGYTYAYNKIGYYEEDGILGEKNLEKAFDAFQKAAQGDYLEGVYNVGRSYKYAIGVVENPELAIENYQKAAEYSYGDALIELALSYEAEYGGLEFDAQKAMDYMKRAADQGYYFAQYKVGYYYYYGLTEKNFEKALEWLHRSYERGYPYAGILLGDYYLYNEGELEQPEYDKAFQYYKTAEENGVVSEGLGVCYEYAIGTEENYFEAFKYYKMGAETGYTLAKYRLGMAYKFGVGTGEDQVEAYRWLSEAANEGNFMAKYNVAMMLLEGEGTTQNLEEGINILIEVAEEGHVDAQFELGNCYLMGKGVTEDEANAMMWYQKAAENGHEQASKIVGKRKRKWKLF